MAKFYRKTLLIAWRASRFSNTQSTELFMAVDFNDIYPKRITSSFSSWIYIEWETLIWRISDSPLLLRLHYKECFITQSTEPLTLSILLPNRKCRLFSAWWVQGIEVRRNVHFFGPALRAPSCRMTLCCVLGRNMLVRERAVHFIPDDPVALTFNC